MNRKYRLKHALGNRYALTAVLFLLITLWGSVTALVGEIDLRTACKGYRVPYEAKAISKSDPTVPDRSLGGAPATALDLSTPTTPWPKQLSAQADRAEAQVTKALENDHSLIQLFGAYQRFSGRTVVEDTADPQYTVHRLPGSSLTFVGQDEEVQADAQAAQLLRLRAALDERDISLLYIQAPSKLDPENTRLPYGVTDPSNDCADRLLAALEEHGVDAMDLRQTLKNAGGTWEDWFYRTDHHWTTEAAFTCFQDIAQHLERYQQTVKVGQGTRRQRIDIPKRYTDPDSFQREVLPGYFLGSQGKRVGSLYAGTDDFTLWTPGFPTLLHYAVSAELDRFGGLEDTLLFSQRVEARDLFGANPYTYYSGGDYPIARITNYYNPQGPRVLLIRDSFACPVTPFLALCSSQLTTIDPRSYTGDLLGCIDSVKPDVVLILYSSGMVRSDTYYRLLPQAAVPSKADALMWKDDWYEGQK